MASDPFNPASLVPPQGGPSTPVTFTVGNSSRAQGNRTGQGPRVGPSGPAGRVTAQPINNSRQWEAQANINGRTFDSLLAFGQKLLNPHIQEAQNRRFWEGMSRAAQGEALADIIEEQPWYSQIFGDSDVVSGARAFAAHAAIQGVKERFSNEMPELRSRAPQEVSQYLIEAINSSMTGDPTADAVIQQAALTEFPTMLALHSKENFAWAQEQANNANIDASVRTAAAVQRQGEAYARGMVSEEAMIHEKQRILDLAKPLDGENPVSWQNRKFAALSMMLQDGNFHAYSAWEQGGVVDSLPPEMRAKLADEKFRRVKQHKAHAASNGVFAEDLGMLSAALATGQYDPKKIGDLVDTVNTKMQLYYGVDEPFLDKAETVGRGYATWYRNEQQAQSKAQEEAQADAYVTANFRSGYGNRSYADVRGITVTKADDIFMREFESAADPLSFAIQNVVNPTPYVSKRLSGTLQDQVQAAVGVGAYGPNFEAQYQAFLQMRDRGEAGERTARAYYGDQYAALEAFHQQVRMSTPPGAAPEDMAAIRQHAFVNAFMRPKFSGEGLDKEARAAVADAAQDVIVPSWWARATGGAMGLSSSATTLVQSLLATRVSNRLSYDAGFTSREAIARQEAHALLDRGDLEVAGGEAWARPFPDDQVPFRQWLDPQGRADEWADRAFKEAFDAAANRVGYNGKGSHEIIRSADVDGEPVFYVNAINEEGDNPMGFIIKGREIKGRYDNLRNRAATPNAIQNLPAGTWSGAAN